MAINNYRNYASQVCCLRLAFKIKLPQSSLSLRYKIHRKMKHLLLLLFLPCLCTAQQLPFQDIERQLIELGYTLLSDTLPAQRTAAAEKIKITLTETLDQPGSFEYPFDSLTSVSILSPKDKSFRIFTWQLYEDIDKYQYFGIIQVAGKKPSVHVLEDQSETFAMEDLPYEVMTKDNWYGALYYNIKEYKTKEGNRYLLFGADGYRFFSKRKLVEVLYFDNDRPIFGDPTFFPTEEDRPDLAYNRFVLNYSAATSVRLNYDDYLSLLIFDNVLPANNEYGQETFLPDGSYRGYELKKGRWIAVEKIFQHTWDEAPRPQPILNGRKQNRDLFGNED